MPTRTELIISLILITLGVVCRLLPHMWNFAPMAGIAIFAGVYMGRRYAIILPIAAMLVGDVFIGFYAVDLMLVIYASYVLIGLGSVLIKRYKSAETILAGSIMAAVLFFLATNWAVWQFSPWYTKNLTGLIECYTMALPFFRGTILGNLFYTGILFGAYEMVMLYEKRRKLVKRGVITWQKTLF